MKSDLAAKITDLLKATDALEAEYEADPFHAEVIEAQGSITAAQAMIDESSKEPDSLTPAEIIALRNDGTNQLESATILHRRAKAKRGQYFGLMGEKLSELKGDVLPVIQKAREDFEAKIEAAVIELSGGYFSNYEKGFTVPRAIAMHRSRELKKLESAVDGRRFGSVDASTKLRQIRAALEAAKSHLS